jgi:hypothetical protein
VSSRIRLCSRKSTRIANALAHRAAAVAGIVVLHRASLQRGRDSFYPAMAGAALTTLLLSAFTNAGLLGNATGLIAAAAVGLGFTQSKSRTAQT